MQVIKNAIKDSFFLSEYVFGCQSDPEERGLRFMKKAKITQYLS